VKKKEVNCILSIYFHEDCIDDLAELEVQADKETLESIMQRMENANPDKMFRLTFSKLINLRSVKMIKFEEMDIDDLTDYDTATSPEDISVEDETN